MKTVLLVDNDRFSRTVAMCAFAPLLDFELVMASSFHEALWTMRDEQVDLVIVHLGLPERDGLNLLAYLANYHPRLPVLTLSRLEPVSGTVDVPCWRGHLRLPVQPSVLAVRVRDSLGMAERGEHRRLMVHDLLRVLAHERETCMLQVKERLSAGHFMLVRGKIVSAVCDSQEGEAAARTMLGWESPWLRVEDAPALLHAPFHVETDEQTPLCMAS